MFFRHSPPREEEAALFRRVEAWLNNAPQARDDSLYDASFFEMLTADEGIDFATAFLFHHLTHQPRYAEAIQQIQEFQKHENLGPIEKKAIVALVPGAFYREHPETGADGQTIREIATQLGFQAELVPVRSVGSLAENARIICRWLQQQPPGPIILVSLSKGGADLKTALKDPNATLCFQNVIAWLNVGGILEGAPMIKWLFRRKWRTRLYRLIFTLRKQDFGILQTLQHGAAGSLGFPLEVPPSWQILHVAGFPLHRHMSSPRAKRWRHRLSEWGPNDSVLLLTELEKLPGLVFPVWGTDHYLQSRWDISNLVRSLLYYIGIKQNLVRSF